MADNLTILSHNYTGVTGLTVTNTGDGTLTYIRPQGTKSITQNGTGIDVTEYAAVDVSVSSGGTPAISVVDTLDSHGGMIRTITALDISDSTLMTADQLGQGVTAYNKNGVKLTGTGGGGSGATEHTIHLEFSDSTDTDIDVYYDDALIDTMITSYEPSTWTYSNKTVMLAQLDNVTWYDKQNIPIGVQLVDYTQVMADTAIDSNGDAEATQWFYASDYIHAEAGMSYSYRASYWYYIAFYNESKTCLGAFTPYQGGGTVDPDDSNTGYGPINAQNVPAGTKYIRLCGTGADSDHMSLIRTV